MCGNILTYTRNPTLLCTGSTGALCPVPAWQDAMTSSDERAVSRSSRPCRLPHREGADGLFRPRPPLPLSRGDEAIQQCPRADSAVAKGRLLRAVAKGFRPAPLLSRRLGPLAPPPYPAATTPGATHPQQRQVSFRGGERLPMSARSLRPL